MNFTIVSGYHYRSPWDLFFSSHWNDCVRAQYEAKRLIIATEGPNFMPRDAGAIILQTENYGHVGDLVNGTRDHKYCGWSMAILLGAMYCMASNTDMVFIEQDVLFKGDIIGQAYKDCEGRGMVFGGKMQSPPYMACAQGFFLLKHERIDEFIHRYMGLPIDREMLPETKFRTIAEQTDWCGDLSFGVDRERPIPWTSPVWYAQHLTEQEIAQWKTSQ